MKTLFFVYIPIFIFSLSFIANGLKTEKNADEITPPTRTEQLSESDEFTNCYAPLSPGLHLGADEGVVTPTGRRFGLNHGFRLFPVHVRLRFFPGRGV